MCYHQAVHEIIISSITSICRRLPRHGGEVHCWPGDLDTVLPCFRGAQHGCLSSLAILLMTSSNDAVSSKGLAQACMPH